MPYGQPFHMTSGHMKPGDAYATLPEEGFYAEQDNLIYGYTPEDWYALTSEEQMRAAADFLMQPQYQREHYGTEGGIQGWGPSRDKTINPENANMAQALLSQAYQEEERGNERERERLTNELFSRKRGQEIEITGRKQEHMGVPYRPNTYRGVGEEKTTTINTPADPNLTDAELAFLAPEGRRSVQGYPGNIKDEPTASPEEQARYFDQKADELDAQAGAYYAIIAKTGFDETNPAFAKFMDSITKMQTESRDFRAAAQKIRTLIANQGKTEEAPPPGDGKGADEMLAEEKPRVPGLVTPTDQPTAPFRLRREGGGDGSLGARGLGDIGRDILGQVPVDYSSLLLPAFVINPATGKITDTRGLSPEEVERARIMLEKGLLQPYHGG